MEWTNEMDAMRSALRTLNDALLESLKGKEVEESAAKEALNIKRMLDTHETSQLDKAWLIDALHQTSIDYQANKGE